MKESCNFSDKICGIILAGGAGTRLHPATLGTSKQLIPIYNKPMIYYPLSSLMLAGIRDILVISTPHEQDAFKRLLNDGSQFGLNLQYAVQPKPEGLAQAFIIGADFVGKRRAALALGDNIFYGHGLPESFRRAAEQGTGATVFGYQVKDPQRYGVVGFNDKWEPTTIVEKPIDPPSNYAITGIYFYDSQVVELAKSLRPSTRGELEITDLNKVYLERKQLRVERLGRGVAWFDTGTFSSLLNAAVYVESVEERQGLMIACPEEIAFRQGFIDLEKLKELGGSLKKNSYGQYLLSIAQESE
ncbi:MAG: glucose-1-phosphate thymidylyltransferase RfbA [SAR324 cluster bacterium]|uniref:Glucose-1-phosphate thymidylyltransferase n=1 Tax=SAR324 cluster bacterium TaxID=2024889 RepID=A0A7X9FSE7_9DELT|nr:glucose-1-phosphate thymidylyltransferase RfbA [SAR324 cluster bacterium]